MLDAVIFDLFNTLTAHDMKRDDVPWTADVLGVPRAVWTRALTEASGPRLTGALNDPIEIIRHLAHSVDASATDDLLATAARCHQELHSEAAEPRAAGRGLVELRHPGNSGLEYIAAPGARPVGMRTVLFSGVIQHTWPERIPELLATADFHISSLDQLFSLPPFASRVL